MITDNNQLSEVYRSILLTDHIRIENNVVDVLE
jgi:hypothetical protein